MAMRGDIQFQVSAEKLSAKCVERWREELMARDEWRARMDEARKSLQSSGVSLEEQPVTGGYVVQPRHDDRLIKAFELSKGRAEQHERQARLYDRWGRLLAGLPKDQEIDFDFDDAEFFGL